jgi:uncharacterized membrane protein YraQ (UPF0718 family)
MLLGRIAHALGMACAMGWQIFWPLVLGIALSAAIQAVVPKRTMAKLLPDDSPKTLAIGCGIGAASSSCSYAAVALARSVFRKGASFTAAMAFELASTNLVLELSLVLLNLMGWQFMLAELVGAPLMVVALALLFRAFLHRRLVDVAGEQANRGLAGKMEAHAEMDMSVTEGPLLERLFSAKGRTAVSHYFVMDWVSIWKDIVLGLILSGFIAELVPSSFWPLVFRTEHPTAARLWGPVIGPVVAVLSFACSVGNIPLAAVLWNGGISFGGVIAFIFADLIVLPILDIYRKYYGPKMAAFLFATFYAAMALAALVVEYLFMLLGLVPHERRAILLEPSIHWNYTTVLNIIFGVLALALVVRFFKTGGREMLRHMNGRGSGHAPPPKAEHDR